jgi:hypothetical protein
MFLDGHSLRARPTTHRKTVPGPFTLPQRRSRSLYYHHCHHRSQQRTNMRRDPDICKRPFPISIMTPLQEERLNIIRPIPSQFRTPQEIRATRHPRRMMVDRMALREQRGWGDTAAVHQFFRTVRLRAPFDYKTVIWDDPKMFFRGRCVAIRSRQSSQFQLHQARSQCSQTHYPNENPDSNNHCP